MHLLENVVTVNIFTAEWLQAAPLNFILAMVIVMNEEPIELTLNCDLDKIYSSINDFDLILEKSGFSREFIQYNTLVDLKPVSEKFEAILSKSKFVKAGFEQHKNELLLLSILLRNYHWLDEYGTPLGAYRTNELNKVREAEKTTGAEKENSKEKKEYPFKQLSPTNQNQVRLRETAALIKILIVYQEKQLKKVNNLQMHLNLLGNPCVVTSEVMLDIVVKGLENTLINAPTGTIGAGVGLINLYQKSKEEGDFNSLKHLIEEINKYNPIKSTNPPINNAIAKISLDIREYLIYHNLIDKKKFLSVTLINFLEEVLDVLNIRYSIFNPCSTPSKDALRTILKDFVKAILKKEKKQIK